MLNILLPTDFSHTANNALIYVLKLITLFEGKITVMHANAKIISAKNFQDISEADEEFKNNFTKNIEDTKRIISAHGLHAEHLTFKYVEGELLSAIQEEISKDDYSLIAMGTTGDDGFDNKLLGSKTAAIIKNVEIPVLSIPAKAQLKTLKNIAVTTIYDQEDAKMLQSLVGFAKKYGVELQVIHVNRDLKSNAELRNNFQNQFKNEPVNFHDIQNRKITVGMYEYIETHKIDMVCAVTRNRNFLKRIFEGSFTAQLTYHLEIPVLIFHEKHLHKTFPIQ